MKERIIKKLKEIEETENIRILYAVESGSRAWGFPSKDSDYDVRFLYTHKQEWYLQLQKRRDTLEYLISDELDICGWDLDKTLLLLRKSNPALLEWLNSPIVYFSNPLFHQEMTQLYWSGLNQKSLIYHYLHMAKGNFREYLQGEQIKIKKYFYVLRPILAYMWIEQFHESPPVAFQELLELNELSPQLLEEIKLLLKRKIAGDELDLETAIPIINQFISEKIDYYTTYVQQLETNSGIAYAELNRFFLEWTAKQ